MAAARRGEGGGGEEEEEEEEARQGSEACGKIPVAAANNDGTDLNFFIRERERTRTRERERERHPNLNFSLNAAACFFFFFLHTYAKFCVFCGVLLMRIFFACFNFPLSKLGCKAQDWHKAKQKNRGPLCTLPDRGLGTEQYRGSTTGFLTCIPHFSVSLVFVCARPPRAGGRPFFLLQLFHGNCLTLVLRRSSRLCRLQPVDVGEGRRADVHVLEVGLASREAADEAAARGAVEVEAADRVVQKQVVPSACR